MKERNKNWPKARGLQFLTLVLGFKGPRTGGQRLCLANSKNKTLLCKGPSPCIPATHRPVDGV